MEQKTIQLDTKRYKIVQNRTIHFCKKLQNYYNRPFTSYIPWGEVGQAAKDGMASGLEQVLNGATLGAYNYLDRHSDNAAAERYNRLQNDAYQAGIGNWYDRVQMANKLAGQYITKIGVINPVYAGLQSLIYK